MGPAATADFMLRLARLTPAERDQDHIPTIVYSDPGTPGRPEAILADGPSPVPAMLRGVEFLNRSQCTLIAIPCNTAHYWYDELVAASHVPIVHIVDATAAQLDRLAPVPQVTGLLATDALIKVGLYAERLADRGITTIDLSDLGTANPVVRGIEQVKRGQIATARALFNDAAEELHRRGASALVLACSEISVALADHEIAGLPVIDASDSLALAVLSEMDRDSSF